MYSLLILLYYYTKSTLVVLLIILMYIAIEGCGYINLIPQACAYEALDIVVEGVELIS